MADGGSSGGSFLTHKIGPLPTWAWIAIGLGVGFFLLRRQSASTAANTGSGIYSTTVYNPAAGPTSTPTTGPSLRDQVIAAWQQGNGLDAAGILPGSVAYNSAFTNFLAELNQMSDQDMQNVIDNWNRWHVLNFLPNWSPDNNNPGTPPNNASPVAQGGASFLPTPGSGHQLVYAVNQ